MKKIDAILSVSKIKALTNKFIRLYLTLLYEYGEYDKCIQCAKQFVYTGKLNDDQRGLVFAYEFLGNCYHKKLKDETALKFFYKMLKVTFYLKDYTSEFNAYEHLGLVYFHLNDLIKARFFHNRMIKGIAEGANSGLRRLKISKTMEGDSELSKKKQQSKRGAKKKDSGNFFAENEESDASDDSAFDLQNNFFSGNIFCPFRNR